MTNYPIGFLVGGQAHCLQCATKWSTTYPCACYLYAINIHPYSQDCCECGTIIYEGNYKRKDNSLIFLFEKRNENLVDKFEKDKSYTAKGRWRAVVLQMHSDQMTVLHYHGIENVAITHRLDGTAVHVHSCYDLVSIWI